MTDVSRDIVTTGTERFSSLAEARLASAAVTSPDSRSFAVLLEGKRAENAPAPIGDDVPPQPGATPPARPWQQTRYLATAGVPRVYRQPGRLRPLPAPSHSAGTPTQGLDIASPLIGETPVVAGSSSARLLSGVAATPPTWAQTAMATAAVKGKDNAPETSNTKPLTLAEYPRPTTDNGWGMHWIPTVSSAPEVVDRFVAEAKAMGMSWMVLLNEGTQIGANDYLVSKLVQNGIMPIMRIYTSGLAPIEGDIESLVRHYKELGVSYYQLYNEPNLLLENDGAEPSVDRYLDVWIPAAKRVIAAGGLPGFGALSPQGEVDDRSFLAQSLQKLAERGESWLLDRGWLSMHNYAGHLPLDNPDGFLRFRQYADILKQQLGRLIPIIGTEAGTYVNEQVDESRQSELVSGAYRYMASQAEPYAFSYTYWIIANEAGGGHDRSFEWQALFKSNGQVSPLVDTLKHMAGRA